MIFNSVRNFNPNRVSKKNNAIKLQSLHLLLSFRVRIGTIRRKVRNRVLIKFPLLTDGEDDFVLMFLWISFSNIDNIISPWPFQCELPMLNQKTVYFSKEVFQKEKTFIFLIFIFLAVNMYFIIVGGIGVSILSDNQCANIASRILGDALCSYFLKILYIIYSGQNKNLTNKKITKILFI